jgi:hypothetical protein
MSTFDEPNQLPQELSGGKPDYYTDDEMKEFQHGTASPFGFNSRERHAVVDNIVRDIDLRIANCESLGICWEAAE